MADQDFNINIRINANTAQVDAIRQSFEKLGAQVQVTNAQAAAVGGGADTAKLIGTIAGGAAIAGVYQMLNGIKQAAQELNGLSAELDKMGARLVENSRQFIQQTNFARDEADVIKVGEAAMKSVAIAHKEVERLQEKELTAAEKAYDIAAKLADPMKYMGKPGPLQQQLEEERASAGQAEAAARATAAMAIHSAKIQEARLASQSFSKTTEELNERIAYQEQLANTHWQQQDVQGYLEASKAAEGYKKELQELKAEHDKLTEKTQKFVDTASPQVRAILANEKAMFEARQRGDTRNADLFEQSALRFRKSATPAQLAEVDKAYSSPALVDALNRNTEAVRNNTELWR